MPELPEVESLRRQIEVSLPAGQSLVGVQFYRGDIRDPIPKAKIKSLVGQIFQAVERRSKYLLFRFERGFLISHLGMTGSWRILQSDEKPSRVLHDHAMLEFSSGQSLVYRDPRRFGVIDFARLEERETHKRFKDLGPEPLSEAFVFEVFFAKLKSSKINIKTLVMNPKLVVGVGNIYASEVLFRVGVRPQRPAFRLTRREAEDLFREIPLLLKRAIDAGGSSIRDYQKLSGESGDFQLSHSVYGREGQPCRICHTSIRMQVLGQRSSFWCPSCQK